MREPTRQPASGRPGRAHRPGPADAIGFPDPAAQPVPPLVVTADPALARALARIGAEAGVRLEVAPHPGAARRRWDAAPLVLVGADQAGAVARAGLPPRPNVALVGRDLDDATVWQRGTAVGASHVLILPDCARWLAGMLAEADRPRGEPGALVAVLSGRGGAGGSTLAAALALAGTRRGLRCTLVDLDPAGGGIDLLFGLETEPGPRWSELARWRDGRLCGRSLREALPTYAARSRHGLAAGLGLSEEGADRLPVLAWPRAERIAAGRPDSADGEDAGRIEDSAGAASDESAVADGLGGLDGLEELTGFDALDGSESELWYSGGTPVRPRKSDVRGGRNQGHLFESGDADEAENPLFGNGSAAVPEELRSHAGASMSAGLSAGLSAETVAARGGESSADTDRPRRESLSPAGVIPLYQGADCRPDGRVAGGGLAGTAPTGTAPTGTAPAGLPVLTWPRTRSDVALPGVAAEPARAVLSALTQAGDLVVVDLPRSLDEAAFEALALATTALIVVPAEVRASAAASQLAAAVRLITPDLRVVVRLPAPGGLEPLDITDVMGGLPLAGVIGPDRRLSAAAEHGEPPGSSPRGSLSAFCRGFLDDLFGAGTSGRSQSRAAA